MIKYITIDINDILTSKTIMHSSSIGRVLVGIGKKAKYNIDFQPKTKAEAEFYNKLLPSIDSAREKQALASKNAKTRWEKK